MNAAFCSQCGNELMLHHDRYFMPCMSCYETARKERDIARFSDIGRSIAEMPKYAAPSLTYMSGYDQLLMVLGERTAIYLEMLAGAFLNETGLKASEARLVMTTNMDGEIKWQFEKR